MPDIQPPKKDDGDEPLIPMPSVTPPPAPDAPSANPPKLTPDKPSGTTPTPTVQKSPSAAKAASNAKPEPAEEPEDKEEKSDESDSKPESNGNGGDLDDIRLKALKQLQPLIDEVDLPPEQKFHTILEIVSVTNDKELIPKLYEAAEGIDDKKEKAQALIDVVSEIEYLNGEDK